MEDSVLQIRNVTKLYPVSSGFFNKFSRATRFATAVDGVSLDIRPREILALVGESGCGKTTLGKLIMRLVEPTAGEIIYSGQDIFKLSKKEIRNLRPVIQTIYQDPYDSMDPRDTVYEVVAEPLKVNHVLENKEQIIRRVIDALEEVELTPATDYLQRFPHELSGGQRQRVAIARALVLRPKVIVADEPVSMLDVSIRAGIVKIIMKLRDEIGSSVLFITHDIALARHIADRIAVMYLGKIVEVGTPEQVVHSPLHPYTRALIGAIPKLDPSVEIEILAKGELPSATNPPPGCRFNPRCPYTTEICRRDEPLLLMYGDAHFAACHHTDDIPTKKSSPN